MQKKRLRDGKFSEPDASLQATRSTSGQANPANVHQLVRQGHLSQNEAKRIVDSNKQTRDVARRKARLGHTVVSHADEKPRSSVWYCRQKTLCVRGEPLVHGRSRDDPQGFRHQRGHEPLTTCTFPIYL